MSRIMDKVVEIANKREESLELSKVEVELGVSQDIKKAVSSSNSLVKKADGQQGKTEKVYNAYNAEQQKATTIQKDLNAKIKELDGLINKASSAAKELGVNPASIDGFSELEKLQQSLFRGFNSLNGYPAIR